MEPSTLKEVVRSYWKTNALTIDPAFEAFRTLDPRFERSFEKTLENMGSLLSLRREFLRTVTSSNFITFYLQLRDFTKDLMLAHQQNLLENFSPQESVQIAIAGPTEIDFFRQSDMIRLESCLKDYSTWKNAFIKKTRFRREFKSGVSVLIRKWDKTLMFSDTYKDQKLCISLLAFNNIIEGKRRIKSLRDEIDVEFQESDEEPESTTESTSTPMFRTEQTPPMLINLSNWKSNKQEVFVFFKLYKCRE